MSDLYRLMWYLDRNYGDIYDHIPCLHPAKLTPIIGPRCEWPATNIVADDDGNYYPTCEVCLEEAAALDVVTIPEILRAAGARNTTLWDFWDDGKEPPQIMTRGGDL